MAARTWDNRATLEWLPWATHPPEPFTPAVQRSATVAEAMCCRRPSQRVSLCCVQREPWLNADPTVMECVTSRRGLAQQTANVEAKGGATGQPKRLADVGCALDKKTRGMDGLCGGRQGRRSHHTQGKVSSSPGLATVVGVRGVCVEGLTSPHPPEEKATGRGSDWRKEGRTLRWLF